MSRVVNIADGWPERGGVYIGRTGQGLDGYFGNPFVVGRDGTRTEVLAKYEEWFRRRLAEDPEFWYRVQGLQRKVLVCFCKPQACHGDVIARYLYERYGDPVTS